MATHAIRNGSAEYRAIQAEPQTVSQPAWNWSWRTAVGIALDVITIGCILYLLWHHAQ